MRVTMHAIHLFLFFTILCLGQISAQTVPDTASQPRAELTLEYSYLHSNLPPGGCGCFNMNGGSAQFAWPLHNSGFSYVADLTVETQPNVVSSGNSLTLSTFTLGTRYRPSHLHGTWQPFAEFLVGGSHGSGSLAAGVNPASGNAGLAFAMMSGGGIDLHINRRFSLRPVQADYVLTTFDNGGNNHQNDLRLGAGVVIRIGR